VETPTSERFVSTKAFLDETLAALNMANIIALDTCQRERSYSIVVKMSDVEKARAVLLSLEQKSLKRDRSFTSVADRIPTRLGKALVTGKPLPRITKTIRYRCNTSNCRTKKALANRENEPLDSVEPSATNNV